MQPNSRLSTRRNQTCFVANRNAKTCFVANRNAKSKVVLSIRNISHLEHKMSQTIFVSIASYRDPEIVSTLKSLCENAAHPEALRIAILLQEDARVKSISNALREIALAHNTCLHIEPVDYRESKGCCWARARLCEHIGDAKYALQLDSHMRFAFRWDEQLLHMLARCESLSPKPLLTSYLPPYNPTNDKELPRKACRIVALRFTDAGTVTFAPRYILEEKGDTQLQPQRTMFFSGHFCFGSSDWLREVPYDPHLYFAGEEDTMSLRLFTHGYDLYAPHNAIAWHQYSREQRPKHWEDHTDWWRDNEVALARVSRILGGLEVGGLGVGHARSASEYASESGIFRQGRESLAHWALHGYARACTSETRQGSSEWIHADGLFKRKSHGGWIECKQTLGRVEKIASFEEIEDHAHTNAPPAVRLYDTSRNLTIEIDGNTCRFRTIDRDFQTLYTGHWICARISPPKRASTPPQQKEEPVEIFDFIVDID